MEIKAFPSDQLETVVAKIRKEMENQRNFPGVQLPEVNVIVKGDREFGRKLYRALEKKGIIVGGVEVPGIPWRKITFVLLIAVFIVLALCVSLLVGAVILFGLIWVWAGIEAGEGWGQSASMKAQAKKGRDDWIVNRDLFVICEKFLKGKSAREIATEHSRNISIAAVKRGIKKGKERGMVRIKMQNPEKTKCWNRR